MRTIVELEDAGGVPETVAAPVRFVFPRPADLGSIRARLAPLGKLRLSGTATRFFADLDPGEPEPLLVALDTIVRSDAAGLERMLLSVLPHVDEIVLGVDARTDIETLRLAMEFADFDNVFCGVDIGMSDADWDANKIDFSAARNLGRAHVRAPWTLVLDSDEYLMQSIDFRLLAQLSAGRTDRRAYFTTVKLQGFEHRDCQRFALTELRWESAMHNQLRPLEQRDVGDCEAVIVEDKSLRSEIENRRRDDQRDASLDSLRAQVAAGDLTALFHLGKHIAARGDVEEGDALCVRYRSFAPIHGVLREERIWLAVTMADRYYRDDDLDRAEQWACRALLDGPSIVAFCFLGNIAESRGSLVQARSWYQAACAITDDLKLAWNGITDLRFGRLAGIEDALRDPETASSLALVYEGNEEPTVPEAPVPD